jgi:hypothetical protein
VHTLLFCYDCVSVSIGFPPKDISMENQSATLSSLGIKSGESLTVKKVTSIIQSVLCTHVAHLYNCMFVGWNSWVQLLK